MGQVESGIVLVGTPAGERWGSFMYRRLWCVSPLEVRVRYCRKDGHACPPFAIIETHHSEPTRWRFAELVIKYARDGVQVCRT
jgi:hypothetical protein